MLRSDRAPQSVRPRVRTCKAMTPRCRPRAGGDPYAAARQCGRARDNRDLGGYVGVDGSSTASMCQNEVVADLIQEEPSVNDLIRIGMDTSKSGFVLHGVDVAEQPVLRNTL